MLFKNKIDASFTKLLKCKELLFVQDIDGVCIPLVSNPLDRVIDKSYVEEVSKLGNEFSVLTCGEHEGKRGVNRIIERAFESENLPKEKGLYLPGLAACGVEYQDRFGNKIDASEGRLANTRSTNTIILNISKTINF